MNFGQIFGNSPKNCKYHPPVGGMIFEPKIWVPIHPSMMGHQGYHLGWWATTCCPWMNTWRPSTTMHYHAWMAHHGLPPMDGCLACLCLACTALQAPSLGLARCMNSWRPSTTTMGYHPWMDGHHARLPPCMDGGPSGAMLVLAMHLVGAWMPMKNHA